MPSAPAKYTEQLIIMVTPATKDHIRDVADAEGASLSEVARTYLDAGIALGGGLEPEEEAPAKKPKGKKIKAA